MAKDTGLIIVIILIVILISLPNIEADEFIQVDSEIGNVVITARQSSFFERLFSTFTTAVFPDTANSGDRIKITFYLPIDQATFQGFGKHEIKFLYDGAQIGFIGGVDSNNFRFPCSGCEAVYDVYFTVPLIGDPGTPHRLRVEYNFNPGGWGVAEIIINPSAQPSIVQYTLAPNEFLIHKPKACFTTSKPDKSPFILDSDSKLKLMGITKASNNPSSSIFLYVDNIECRPELQAVIVNPDSILLESYCKKDVILSKGTHNVNLEIKGQDASPNYPTKNSCGTLPLELAYGLVIEKIPKYEIVNNLCMMTFTPTRQNIFNNLNECESFLNKDSDGDGLADLFDNCPNEFGVLIDGCPINPKDIIEINNNTIIYSDGKPYIRINQTSFERITCAKNLDCNNVECVNPGTKDSFCHGQIISDGKFNINQLLEPPIIYYIIGGIIFFILLRFLR